MQIGRRRHGRSEQRVARGRWKPLRRVELIRWGERASVSLPSTRFSDEDHELHLLFSISSTSTVNTSLHLTLNSSSACSASILASSEYTTTTIDPSCILERPKSILASSTPLRKDNVSG